MSAPRALLLDLDGTLVDTAGDLLAALDAVRAERGLAQEARRLDHLVSAGALALLRESLGELPADELAACRARFLDHYRRALAVHSRVYPGWDQLQACCAARGIGLAVVTNKPGALARALLDRLAVEVATVVGGDDAGKPKPDPAPLRLALSRLGVSASAAWMVGDDPRDLEAARAAGCLAVFARHGYGAASLSTQADRVIDGLADLAEAVVGKAR